MHIEHLIKQKSYERVVLLLRRDLIVLFFKFLFFLLLVAAPIAVYYMTRALFPDLYLSPLARPILVLIGSTYAMSIWLFAFTVFLDFYLDVWLVTNDRIVNVNQEGLFARTISELDLYKIQDVTSQVHGVFPTMFNYGNVYIQTAGVKERFVFEQVPNPHEVRKTIIDLMAEDKKFHGPI